NSANATFVGTAAGIDPDGILGLTYSLTDDAAGRFAIDSTTGAITVADGTLLDFETDTSHQITVRATDGGLLSIDKVISIGVNNVNEAPVNILPGTLATGVNTPLVLSGGHAIQLSDVDADANDIQLTLTASQGTMTLASLTGLSFITGDGTADSTIVVRGTLAELNAALDGLSFSPTGGFSGTATITVLTDDLGNSGSGGNLTDSNVLSIQVGGVRFQEGVNGYVGTQDTFINSGSGNTSYGGLNYVLADDPSHNALIRFDNLFGSSAGQIAIGSTIQTASLSIYVTHRDAHDWVNVHRMLTSWSEASTWNTLTNGISANNVEASSSVLFSIDAGQTGWVTITGLTSVVQDWANGALNHGFAFLSNNADGWRFHSSEFSDPALRPYLTIGYAAPQLAAIDLDANNSSGATGSGFATSFTENGGAVLIADSDATLTDADSSHLTSLTVTITNLQDGALESLAANTTGTSINASYDSGTGVLTLSGSDSVANYQQVLRTVTYNNTSESPATTNRLITFQAADAFVHGTVATATVSITAVNDAPVLDNSGDMTLSTITEDQTTNSGNTVASIITSAGGDRITDVDSAAVEGIAITSLGSGNGTWQYSINNGSDWLTVGSVADNSALLLRSTDLVRFVPNAENATTADFTFRAWDQTTGTAGTKVDASTNGNTTSFSTATEVASITVTAVNDAPVLDASRTPVLNSVSEHAGPPLGAVGTLVSSLIDFATPSGQVDNVTDVDAGANTGIAITATNANHGTWWYSIDNGSTWLRVGNASPGSARLLAADANTRIYFEPTQSTEYSGTISNAITFRAWDGTSGSNGGLANTSTNGGTTAFSSATDTAAITVTNVNDAPRLLGADLIINGQFTTDLTGWTTSGTVVPFNQTVIFGSSNQVGPHSISQTIATVAGQTYQLSFDYSDGQAGSQSLVASATGNGNLLTTSHIVTDVWASIPVRYTYTFVADSNSTTITLTDTSDQSGLTNNGTNGIDGIVDNVSVRQLSGEMGGFAYTQGDGATAIHPTVSLLDFDSANLVGATIQISSGFAGSEDVLTFTDQLGITGSYNSTNGVLTLTGISSVANYQTALRSITYENTSGSPSGSRAISFTADDGAMTSAVASRSIVISNVNDAPIAVSDAATAIEAGGVANGTAGTNPTGNVLTNDTDVDTGDTKEVIGVIAGAEASANGSVNAAVTGTYGSITIAADGTYTYTVDNNNAAVQALRTSSDTLQDIFTYTMEDSGGLTSTTQITVTIEGRNDTPHDITTAGLTVAENSPINTTVVGTVVGQDVDSGEAFSYSLLDNAGSRFQIHSTTGVVTVAAGHLINYEDNASHEIQVRVTDASGAFYDEWMTVTVTDVNETPQIIGPDAGLMLLLNGSFENGATDWTLSGAAQITNSLDWGAAPSDGDFYVLLGTGNQSGGTVETTLQTVVGEIYIVSFDYNANANPGSQQLRVEAIGGAILLNQTVSANADWIPNYTQHNFTFIADSTQTILRFTDVSVSGSNRDGNLDNVRVSSAFVIAENAVNSTIVGNVQTIDPDLGDTLTFQLMNDAGGRFAIDSATGAITVANRSLLDFETTTSHAVTVRVTDAGGLFREQQFNIRLTNVNEDPVAVADTATAVEAGGTNNGTAGTNPTGNVLTNDTDPDAGETREVIGVSAGVQLLGASPVSTPITGTFGSI
ncbi:MAG TPA: hypothetical protein DDZ51_25790, partial [Planctomycetaceae bacterium]|nr:hypothetical protein [Planctomycetaceae bacterium]